MKIKEINELAELEGWGIFEVDNKELQIQAYDEKAMFKNGDLDVWDLIACKIKEGSVLHFEALKAVGAKERKLITEHTGLNLTITT